MTENNYYRLHVQGHGEFYEYGQTALEAIALIREELRASDIEHVSITARPAVYKEWNYPASAYTNGGTFLGMELR